MADSHDTRIAPAIPQPPAARLSPASPWRRLLAFQPSLARFRPRPCHKALAQAIERHKAARAAFDAQEDSEDDEFLNGLGWAEWGALEDLVETPCANDAELFKSFAICSRTKLFSQATGQASAKASAASRSRSTCISARRHDHDENVWPLASHSE